MGSVKNISWYNENLINLIENKLDLYNVSKIKGYKQDMKNIYERLEGIQETLATMNIDLEINYRIGVAVFHDLNNNFKINI